MIEVIVSVDKPLRQLIDFEIRFKAKSENVKMSFAAWRPGRYEIANFSQNLQKPNSTHSFLKTTKDTFELMNNIGEEISFKYQYWAGKMDAGNTWLDDEQLYINFINCLPQIHAHEDEQINILFDMHHS